LLITLPLPAICETLFVSDTLRVGIRTEPNNNVPSIAIIKSGVKIEVLERQGAYIKVRTKSGVEGWVKSAYFSSKMPAATRLKRANKKINKLENKIDSLNNQLSEKAPDLSDEVQSLTSLNQSMKTEIKKLESRPPEKAMAQLSLDNINENVIYIVLGIFVMLISVGFLLGVSWHKNQIAKRLGGMSI